MFIIFEKKIATQKFTGQYYIYEKKKKKKKKNIYVLNIFYFY